MSSKYEASGVSIDAGQRAVDLMKDAVTRTHGPAVLAGVGAFGGLFSLGEALTGMDSPTLVASTDGVGTKVKLAATLGRYDSIGHDIVNHCLNDIFCAGEGVKPLFFLDYVASSRLKPEMVAAVVTGMAEACSAAGCALLGGETAEMPGVYAQGEFDVVGTIVGMVDRKNIYPKPSLQAGDVLIGLPSSGAHTNGYSLIRAIFHDTPLERTFPDVGVLGDALLVPHRAYAPELTRLREAGIELKSLAHITGGGFTENVPRALAGTGLGVSLQRGSWPVPPLFQLIQTQGEVSDEEMLRVFNMGVGMVLFVGADAAERVLGTLEQAWRIGEVTAETGLEWR